MPFLLLLYLVCYLDRVNIGFAALRMNHDLGLSATAYGLGAGIFFVGYSLFEIPSNLILARVGARLWIGRIMITWGILACAMMFVRDARSLYIVRFLLGVAEGGFFPGIVYYLYCWFPAADRVKAMGWFMMGIPLSAVVGGPLSGALLSLNGRLGLAGWQWLFLIEGAPAVLLGFAVFARLDDRPDDATWLLPEERAWLIAHLAHERHAYETAHALSVWRALAHPTVWRIGAIQGLAGIASYAIGLWLPQIVRAAIGQSDLVVGIVSAVPPLVAVAAIFFVSVYVDRTGERLRVITTGSLVSALGLATSAFWLHSPVPIVLALAIGVAAMYATYAPTLALPSFFLTGTASAAAIALVTALGNVGGFVGPYLVGVLKDTTGDYKIGLLALAIVTALRAPIALSLHHARVLVRA
ncbi:MAG TPA: MFS transporter [Gemmatimonadaceae bacterium]|nr:MFS transporter [Gemmatimonadaceae bacterium]